MLIKKVPKNLPRYFSSTVDANEIQQFSQYTDNWWDKYGPMKPLHSMNKLRIPFVREGLVNTRTIDMEKCDKPLPLKGLNLLDVGCGGGILSEPLARLGGAVTGLDANPSIIRQAQEHAKKQNLRIEYVTSSIEGHAADHCAKYDAVVASEILEHVTKKSEFLKACVACLKPGGSIFVTTINKTALANFTGVILAENVFKLLPKGTHEYDKFLEPHKLQRILEDENCRTELIHGMCYNFFTNTWSWTSDTSVNYSLHGVKGQN